MLDKVLDRGSTPQQTKVIIRLIALIRSGQFPITTLGDLQSQVTSIALIPERFRHSGYQSLLHISHLPQMTSSINRGIVATARRLLSLTFDVLQYYLQRFRQMTPLTVGYNIGHVKSALRCRQSRGSRVTTHDIGSPSWTEEQLVYRGLWQIQLIEDLKCAVEHGIGPHWSNLEKYKLQTFTISKIYDFDEMAYFDHLLILRAGGRTPNGYQETVDQGIVFSIQDYLAERRDDLWPPDFWSQRPWPAPKPRLEERTRLDDDLSNVVEVYTKIFGGHQHIDLIGFDPYRSLGMSIWDPERLSGYGIDLTAEPDSFVWLSILQPRDLAVLKKGKSDAWTPPVREPVPCFGDRTYEHVNPLMKIYKTILYDWW